MSTLDADGSTTEGSWDYPDLYDLYPCAINDDNIYLVYIQLSMGIINCIVCLTSGAAFIYNSYSEKSSSSSSESQSSKHYKLKFLAWFATLIGSICPFLFYRCYTTYYRCYDLNDNEDTIADSFKFISMLLYVFILSIVLILFSIRLIKTFSNTQYAMSKRFKYWIIFVTFILLTGSLVAVTLLMIDNEADALGAGGANAILITSSLLILFDVFCGIVLLFLFLSKLTAIIANYNVAVSNNNDNDNDNDDVIMLDEMISDMSKYTILVCIAMASTLIVAFMPILLVVSDVNDVYVATILCIDSFVNGICLILQFKISNKIYFVLCNCLHKQCIKRQKKYISKYIRKQQNTNFKEKGNANGQEMILKNNNINNIQTATNVEMQSAHALRI